MKKIAFIRPIGVTLPTLSFLKLSHIFWRESVAQLPNRFIRNGHSTLGQKVSHIQKAQTEAMKQPNCAADDCWRESVFVVVVLSIIHPYSLTN
jgi:hypothetical protein